MFTGKVQQDGGLELLTGFLRYNPTMRFTALEALEHRYFDDIRNRLTHMPGLERIVKMPPLLNFSREGTHSPAVRFSIVHLFVCLCGGVYRRWSLTGLRLCTIATECQYLPVSLVSVREEEKSPVPQLRKYRSQAPPTLSLPIEGLPGMRSRADSVGQRVVSPHSASGTLQFAQFLSPTAPYGGRRQASPSGHSPMSYVSRDDDRQVIMEENKCTCM